MPQNALSWRKSGARPTLSPAYIAGHLTDYLAEAIGYGVPAGVDCLQDAWSMLVPKQTDVRPHRGHIQLLCEPAPRELLPQDSSSWKVLPDNNRWLDGRVATSRMA